MKMEVEGTKKYKFMNEDGDYEIALKFEVEYWIFPNESAYFFHCNAPYGSKTPLMCFTLDSIDADKIREEIDKFIDDDISGYANKPDSELYKDAILLKNWLNSCVRPRMEEKHA